MTTLKQRLLTVFLFAIMISVPCHSVWAATAPSLGTAQDFAVLGGSTVTNTGTTIIATGNLGVQPGTAVTGFPPGVLIGGTQYIGGGTTGVAGQAQKANAVAYASLAGQACDFVLTGQDLVGMTLVPGVYCFTSSAQLTGTLTLDALGDPSAVWVFQIGSTLTTAVNSSVKVINGGQQCNVFWQIGSSATIGTNTSFIGNILALTSITLNTNTNVSGRALAQNGAVTMDSNAVAISVCAAPPGVHLPPTLGKAFSPVTINTDGTSTLTLTLSNPDSTATRLTAPLTDTLPTGMLVAGKASTDCSGNVTAPLGASTVTLTGGTIPPNNGSCTVIVPVTAANGGNYINLLAAGALKTGNGNNASSAISTLTVNSPLVITPALGKAFSPAIINAGGTSTLTLTLSNPDAKDASLTAPFTDTLPSGVLVAGSPNTTCGGVVTATTGGSKVILTGGSIPAKSSCTVTVTVTAANGGNFINSLAAGALQTGNGNNASPAIATLTVNAPVVIKPTLGKAFSPATINAGGISTLTITLSNPDSTIASLIAPFTDTLPTGIVVAGSASTSCNGTVNAPTGGSTVTLVQGSIPANNGSCTITVPVMAANGGSYINSLAAGALKTSNGNNISGAISTLTVNFPIVIPPTLGKAFSPVTINAGETSTLTLTLSNPDATAASLIAALTDTLPSGIVVAGGATTTCGGTVTAATGDSKVILTGGSIPAMNACTVTVIVTAANGGNFINSLAAGALQTANGNNTASAIATLTVNAPGIITPTLGKTFNPTAINAGDISTLTITLSNPAVTVASLTAPLTDTLPAGMVVAGNASTTCSGTVTAPTGGSTLILAVGNSIPANSACTVTVPVTAANGGNYINSLDAGALQTGNGRNAGPAIATLTVNALVVNTPTLGKAFSPATINAGGSSTLTLTLSNPGAKAASLTAPLIDTLPSGLVVGGIARTTCSKILFIALTNRSKVTLKSGSIPANSSCTVTVKVIAANAGNYINSLAAGALQTSNGSNAASAIATLTVNPPVGVAPRLGKSFSPATIDVGSESTLILTLSNAGSKASILTAPLIDTLPTGVIIVGTASNSCGGKLTATPGSAKVILTEATIPAKRSCTVMVKVTSASRGNYINSLAVGALQTNNGNNGTQAIATLTVFELSTPGTQTAVTLSKTFNPATIEKGDKSKLTITLSNVGDKAASLTAPLIDNLPSGVVVDGYASTTCGGKVIVDSSTVTLKSGTIPAYNACTVTVTVIGMAEGGAYNSLAAGDLQTNKGSNDASTVATLTVLPATNIVPTLNKVFKPATINAGGVSTLTITLKNPNSTIANLTAPFTDSFPSGLVVAGKASTTCGGTITAAMGGSKVILKGCYIPAKSACTVKVNVTAKAKGNYSNKLPVGALKTNKGNNAYQAVATLKVMPASALLTLGKAFSPATINPGGSSTLTITLNNPNNTVANLTAPLTDSFPSGMIVSGKASTTCGGTITAAIGGSKVILKGCFIPAKSSCSVKVPVTAKSKGSYNNKLPAGALKTNKGNNIAQAAATLTVKANSW